MVVEGDVSVLVEQFGRMKVVALLDVMRSWSVEEVEVVEVVDVLEVECEASPAPP